MSKVETTLPCSFKCPFGRDCAGKYSLGICKEIIDEATDRFITEPLEEKIVHGNEIVAAMTDHNGKVTVSEGQLRVEVEP